MTETRNRSYGVRRQVPPGARVRITQDFTYYQRHAAGKTGVVQSFDNAGLPAGIEATVVLDEPIVVKGEKTRRVRVSAGILQLVGGPHDAAVSELERSGWAVSVRGDGGTILRRDYYGRPAVQANRETIFVMVDSLGKVGKPYTIATEAAERDLSRLPVQR